MQIRKERGNSYQKTKRSSDERHTETHRSLTDMFRHSQMYFTFCDCPNVSMKFPCVYLCLSFGDLLILSVIVSSFYSYFYVTRTWALSLSTWKVNKINKALVFTSYYLDIFSNNPNILSRLMNSSIIMCRKPTFGM